MKSRNLIAIVLSLALATMALTACSNSSSSTGSEEAETTDVAMSYISADDTLAAVETGDTSYLVVDVRAADDYAAGHIEGAISADMDAAVSGDTDAGVETMTAALEEATDSATGGDYTLVLVCYSGKSYAQAGTNALSSMGADMDNVYTLEGGMEAWGGDTVTD